MSEKAPAFQFYPKDWLSDSNVKAMSVEAKGAYIELLCVYWLENGLPSSTDRLARLIGLPGAKFRRLWPQVAPCFTVAGDRLRQKRMDRERAKQEAFKTKRAEAGLEGAKSRWLNKPPMAEPINKDGTAIGLPLANDSSSVSVLLSATASTENKRLFSSSDNAPNGNGVPDGQRRAYADEVWSEFLRISGQRGTRQISPLEFDVLKRWMDAGIPLAIVLRGFEDTNDPRKASTLAYFAPSVLEAVEKQRQAVPL